MYQAHFLVTGERSLLPRGNMELFPVPSKYILEEVCHTPHKCSIISNRISVMKYVNLTLYILEYLKHNNEWLGMGLHVCNLSTSGG